jgi:hypothetical protein
MLARKQIRACDGAGRLARPRRSPRSSPGYRAPQASVGLLAIALAATAACLGPRGGAPTGDGAGAATGAATGAASGTALAIVRDDVALPLPLLIGQVPQDVESLLGEPLTKGMRRGSCVRFVPERVFYTCEHVEQTYADKTGTFARVRVEFDDGVATRVAFDGTPGEGPFTPEQALAAVGLTLPEPGRRSEPAAGVELWSWFNGRSSTAIGPARGST